MTAITDLISRWDDAGYVALPNPNEAPMAVDVPEPIPQPGYGHAVVFIVMGMGAFIGGVVIVVLHVWGVLL